MRHQPVHRILVAIPRPPGETATLAAQDVTLVAARLAAAPVERVELPTLNPPLAVAKLYKEIEEYDEVHALIAADSATTLTTITALAIHASRNNARITVQAERHDPGNPYTLLELHAFTAIQERLPPSLHRAALHLYREQQTTPTRLAEAIGVSVSTAAKLLRRLRRLGLAEYIRGRYYATPLLSLYHTLEATRDEEEATG